MDLDECYQVAVALAKEGGQIAFEALNKTKQCKTKTSPTDFVTEIDEKVERLIFSKLAEKFPDHKFIGEESSAESGIEVELTDDPTWIVDPIDGTLNFVHSFPCVAVSIALVIKKETVLAVVYDVGAQKLYTARKGKGAYCEDKKLSVSKTEELAKSLVLADLNNPNNPEILKRVLENVERIFKNSRGIRVVGSAVIAGCLVASGCAQGYYSFKLQCWDVSAIELLITEAGGVVIDPAGRPFDRMSKGFLCASSISVANEISKLITDIRTYYK